jgi:hypothetical protein
MALIDTDIVEEDAGRNGRRGHEDRACVSKHPPPFALLGVDRGV